MSDSTPTAPDFDGHRLGAGYPIGAGRSPRIGPAWQAIWDLLADGAWHGRRDLLQVAIAAADPPLAPRTAGNLLRDARIAGHLEQRHRGKRYQLRRTDQQ